MSRNYDNWERLVAGVLKREELWQLFHAESVSPSISSESSGFSFSFGVASSLEDASYSSPEWSAANLREKDDEIGTGSIRGVVNDQPQSPVKNVASKPFWKRALKIEVPKLRVHHRGSVSPAKSSPKASPRMTRSAPGSRDHSGGVTPLHSGAGKRNLESPTNWPDDAKHEAHPLPLPPASISNYLSVSCQSSAETSPSVPHTPERTENRKSLGTQWKKGKLLSRSGPGYVYLGFNSEKGAMCAMKEVSLSFVKSKQHAKALEKEIALLSSFSHPNIIQYNGSEMLDKNLYIYFEYMSGGSICKILKQYGSLGESAIRNYTRQILAGLAYLHSKTIPHGDIKGANVLVDPHGVVKLINLGVEKHILQITGQRNQSWLSDSPYWMAPEAIMNPKMRSLHMDIWSLGCTIIEMATSKPPMSKYDEGLAMFKVANNKELPAIPDHLSDEGKDFLRHCFHWIPLHRATASQLLEHPFVRSSSPMNKSKIFSTSSYRPAATDTAKTEIVANTTFVHQWDSRRHAIHASRAGESNNHYTPYISLNADGHTPRRYISAPVSPVGSPLPHPNSPQRLNGQVSPPLLSTSPVGGIRPVPYPQLNPSVLPQETNHKKSPRISSPSYWDPNILRSQHAGTPTNAQSSLDVRVAALRAPVKSVPYRI